MAETDHSDDKELPATQRRLERARESGNVPLSRDAVSFAVLASVVLVLVYQEPGAIRAAVRVLSRFIASSYDQKFFALYGRESLITALGWMIGPVLIASGLAATLAVFVQTRMLIRTEAAAPDLSRVYPLAGLKRLFGLSGLAELVKSLAKLAIATAVTIYAVQEKLSDVAAAPRYDVRQLSSLLGPLFVRLLVAGVVTQAIIGLADFAWTNFKHARNLRMSKQDIRNEYKETEGSPIIKGHLRSIARARLKNNIRQAVPKATVVVTNPTHYAVALSYESAAGSAPTILAKGADILAAEIRKVAKENNIPLVENPPLARALYRLDVDSEIPEEHYKAVAEIIAFVWRLRGPRSG